MISDEIVIIFGEVEVEKVFMMYWIHFKVFVFISKDFKLKVFVIA